MTIVIQFKTKMFLKTFVLNKTLPERDIYDIKRCQHYFVYSISFMKILFLALAGTLSCHLAKW